MQAHLNRSSDFGWLQVGSRLASALSSHLHRQPLSVIVITVAPSPFSATLALDNTNSIEATAYDQLLLPQAWTSLSKGFPCLARQKTSSSSSNHT
jgi:hypothetical protein